MTKKCEFCGRDWTAKRRSKKFCSWECAKSYRAVSPRECKNPECLVEFTPPESLQVFCSHSCSAIVSNKNKKVKRYCWCGAILHFRQKIACSRSHAFKYKKKNLLVGGYLVNLMDQMDQDYSDLDVEYIY